VLDSLGLSTVTLVGHSFGGRPTALVALEYPARVRLLVLVDAAIRPAARPAMEPRPPRPPVLLSAALASAVVRDPLVASTVTNPLLTRVLLRQLIFDSRHATDARVRMLQAQLRVSGTTHELGQWARGFLAGDQPSRTTDPVAYRTLTMPTLLIWGARDVITPLAQGETLRTLLPRGEMVVLEDTGHIPALENPAAFNQALLEFLERHRPG
jgi:pimeloyl-ACP methyl ester carboxylesterase